MAPPYPTKKSATYNPDVRDTGCNGDTACWEHDNRNCNGSTEDAWDSGYKCGDCSGSSGIRCLKNSKLSAGGSKYCPHGLTGTVSGIQYFDNAHNLICTYSAVTNPLDQLDSFFDTNVSNQIKLDRCTPKTYSQLAASSECLAYYGSQTANSELLRRIEATNGAWVNDPPQRDFVQQVVADEVLEHHPTSDVSSRAKRLISDFCNAHPDDPKCGCYNAVNKGLSGCQSAPDGTPGCAELKALGIQFDNAPDEFKPIFQNMKNQVNAMCLSENCKTARGSTTNSAGILLPGTVPGGDCASNFNVCLTKLTVGQMTGGSIDASCKQEFNLPGGGGSGMTAGSPSMGGGGGGGAPVTTGSDGSTLLITNPTVANVLDTNTKQYGAIGGCIFIILICLVLIVLSMGGDSSSSGPSASNIAFARLAGAGN